MNGNLATGRHLAPAQLVDDLARLLIGERVVDPADVAGEEAERAGGEGRLEGQHLERGDERVTPERRDVPGDARVGDEPVRRLGEQQVKIAPGARDPHGEEVVVAAHLGAAPVERLGDGPAASQGLAVAERGRRRRWLGGRRRHHGDLGARARLQDQPVLGAGGVEPIGRRREAQRGRAHDVVEAAIAERGLVDAEPIRQPHAAPLARMAAHLEDVHEVGRESQRHAELVRVLGEGLDHQHLVELPAVHGEPPGHPQGAARRGAARASRAGRRGW